MSRREERLQMYIEEVLGQTVVWVFPNNRSGKSSESHAEGARSPRRQSYLSVIFGVLKPRAGLTVSLMTYLLEVGLNKQISVRSSTPAPT